MKSIIWLLKRIFSVKTIVISMIIFFCFLFIWFIWLNLYISASAKPYIVNNMSDLEFSKIWFILWASVYTNWELSDTLKDRVDSAILAYKDKKIDRFLVSWDNGSVYYDEVSAVKKYLIRAWIPEDIIYLDYAWFDTYDSIYRAKHIFWVEDMIIFTQKFHLPRSLYIASNIWIKAQWFPSDRHEYLKINYFVFREKFANVKAFLDINLFHSMPKFLWEKINIF